MKIETEQQFFAYLELHDLDKYDLYEEGNSNIRNLMDKQLIDGLEYILKTDPNQYANMSDIKYAIKLSDKEIFKLIYDNAVKQNIAIRNEELAFCAAQYGEYTILKYIMKKFNIDPNANYGRLITASAGNTECTELLLGLGADPNLDEGWAFILASKAGNMSTMRLLKKYGADIHAKNDLALKTTKRLGLNNACNLIERMASGLE